MSEFLTEIDALLAASEAAFSAAEDAESLEAARIDFLGAKKGRLKSVQKLLGGVPKEEKPAAGKRLNEVKGLIQAAFEASQQRIAAPANDAAITEAFDPSLPGATTRIGKLHPITQTIEELTDIMGRLGFSVALGPEVEDERHNFEALNISLEHPARDPLDNFYLATASKNTAKKKTAPNNKSTAASGGATLMRSQTSTVQIRVMENTPPPIRIISLGRVYRPDEADKTHYPMFHQMEGLWIDTDVTMADLKTVLRLFAVSYLGADVHVRFRPSFFPFTEPSVEADYLWNGAWVEFGGAGMVDPNVLKEVGYDPEEVIGFAFGLGVERLCMRRHNITDIREFYRNNVRFLHQF